MRSIVLHLMKLPENCAKMRNSLDMELMLMNTKNSLSMLTSQRRNILKVRTKRHQIQLKKQNKKKARKMKSMMINIKLKNIMLVKRKKKKKRTRKCFQLFKLTDSSISSFASNNHKIIRYGPHHPVIFMEFIQRGSLDNIIKIKTN